MARFQHSLRSLGGLAALIATVSCSHTHSSELCVPCDPSSQNRCVIFRVISVTPGGADLAVPSAPVFLSNKNGLLLLGHTPVSGEFVFTRSAIAAQPKPAVLMFCWDHISLACTAVRLDLPDATYWDTFNVTLPVNPLGSPQTQVTPDLVLPVKLP